jgi:hypothetical protein
MDEVTGKARGGLARAEALSKKQRRDIAKAAATARWADLPQAICGSPDRPLRIGDHELQCYVLEDGTRVLSQAEFLEALGRHRKANVRREGGEEPLPAILQGKAINPFITKEIIEKSRPIKFRTPSGALASGYRADLLPIVCEIYLKARDANVLPPNQQHVARQAEILMRALAHVGIIALVDEATGYQEFRTKDALSRILEAFVAKELQPWVKTFPDEYYAQLFRLRGLDYRRDSVKRPQYFGTLTNDIVYKRLAPGVLAELKKVIPKSETTGRPKGALSQALTRNIGYPKLKEHLGAVVAYMTVSDDYLDFVGKLDRFRPRFGEQYLLPFDYEPEKDDGKGL